MSGRAPPRGFAARPGPAEAWIGGQPPVGGKPELRPLPPTGAPCFTARLTIDVTPAMRGRIKIAAFARGETVADMLRALFEREYPDAEAPR